MNENQTQTSQTAARIVELLSAFKLPTASAELIGRFSSAGWADALPALLEVLELEADDRRERRVDRLRRASRLPPGKVMSTLDRSRLPRPLAQQIDELARGAFLDRSMNVLAFGRPGVGKSHAACAIGHELVAAGHSVYLAPAYELVQELLAAKRGLDLPRALRKLDAFELLIIDDIGYVQQSSDEIEVLFTLMAERYERRSMLITSNLVFSEWGRIFKDPMTTAAAIDRLVHHSVILEFAVPSYRTEAAKKRNSGLRKPGGSGDFAPQDPGEREREVEGGLIADAGTSNGRPSNAPASARLEEVEDRA
jgi:DNA replication protein DnaC